MRSPEVAFEEPDKEIAPREVERAELFHRLEQRADQLLEFKKSLADLDPATPEEDFNRLVDEEFRQAYEGASEVSQEGFRRSYDLGFKIYLAVIKKKGNKKVASLRQQRQAIFDSDDGAQYLNNLYGVAQTWKEKHGIIAHLAQDPTSLPTLVQKTLSRFEAPLDPNHIVGTKVSATHAAIILDSEYYDQILQRPNTGGIHFSYSPWSFIRDRGAEKNASIIDHEAMHNFLDGAVDIKAHQAGRITQEVASLSDLTEEPEMKSGIIKEYTANLQPDELIDEFQHELIAGLDQAEQETFQAGPWDDEDSLWFERARHYAYGFSTAGLDARKLGFDLQKLSEEQIDPTIGEEMNQKRIDFLKRFTSTVDIMREAISRAAVFGPEMSERIHAMFLVLPPSKYRHISRYVESLQ